MRIFLSKSGLTKLEAILIVGIIAIGSVGAGYFAATRMVADNPSATPTLTPTPTSSAATPTPTSTPTLTPTSTPTPTESAQSAEAIRIGICGDIDMLGGNSAWQGALLAAEQVNSQGGVLGRKLVVVAEDSDDEVSSDIAVISNALTRLITVDKADYIVTSTMGIGPVLALQDASAEHKKILFSVRAGLDNLTQRV